MVKVKICTTIEIKLCQASGKGIIVIVEDMEVIAFGRINSLDR